MAGAGKELLRSSGNQRRRDRRRARLRRSSFRHDSTVAGEVIPLRWWRAGASENIRVRDEKNWRRRRRRRAIRRCDRGRTGGLRTRLSLRYNKKAGTLFRPLCHILHKNKIKSYRHLEDTRRSVPCMSPVVGTKAGPSLAGDCRDLPGRFVNPSSRQLKEAGQIPWNACRMCRMAVFFRQRN